MDEAVSGVHNKNCVEFLMIHPHFQFWHTPHINRLSGNHVGIGVGGPLLNREHTSARRVFSYNKSHLCLKPKCPPGC